MKAVVLHEHGDLDVPNYEDIPDSKVGFGEVLVKIRASGCNHNDIWAGVAWQV